MTLRGLTYGQHGRDVLVGVCGPLDGQGQHGRAPRNCNHNNTIANTSTDIANDRHNLVTNVETCILFQMGFCSSLKLLNLKLSVSLYYI